jgi:ADP-ribose pyrophosphatase YjhB (NUDIX family)
MDDKKYVRKIKAGVTNFLYCGDEYLFLKRNPQKKIDPNKINGIGGKVELGENYLEAAIRETKEETGYVVMSKDIQLSGVVILEGGYQEDWVMCFFNIKVPNKNMPLGSHTDDGELIWIPKNRVLNNGYDLVDDINHCFEYIINGEKLFFMTAKVGADFKIKHTSIASVKKFNN